MLGYFFSGGGFRKLFRRILSGILIFMFVVTPIMSCVVYEAIFNRRFETENWMKYSVSDFDGLIVKEMLLENDQGNFSKLAAYEYYKTENIKGTVILAHGMGGGGHNFYMPFIDIFAEAGYLVFTYDATGNDNSSGRGVRGMPQGLSDLCCAVEYVYSNEKLKDLPVMLFGHSWGGYAVGNVLNFYPDINAVAIISGFNKSEDMMLYQSKKYVGELTDIFYPYVGFYERLKFTERLTGVSAVSGIENSTAKVFIAHSTDDDIVPKEYLFDVLYEKYSFDRRFTFSLFENRGHEFVLYSEDSLNYRTSLKGEYDNYLSLNGKNASLTGFIQQNVDKDRCFQPDMQLMNKIISVFDSCMV